MVLRDKLGSDIAAGGGAKMVSRQFNAPLGMIYLRQQVNNTDTDFNTAAASIILHCKPGSYKGVAAESLTA